ncbi:MAG: HlyD family secretion protein [Bacteroidia bacterium]
MPETEYISSRSEEIQDIMERTPGWMMRWGISMFLVFLLMLVGLSWFIQYSDVITTRIQITSEHPPISLVAESGGKLRSLFVKDKDPVDSNQVLALIDNPADYKHVLVLKALLNDTDFISKELPALQIGEIESAYAAFKQARDDYHAFRSIGLYEHKIMAVRQQEGSEELLYNRILQQFHTLTEDYQLSLIKCRSDSQLFANGVIPKLEYNTLRSVLLQKKYGWEGANSTLAQTQVQLQELRKTITELELQSNTDRAKYVSALEKSLNQLKTSIKTWEQKYVVISPMRGIVNLFNYWATDMAVKQGDVLMIVCPINKGKIIGRISLQTYGSAKVKEGLPVNVKLSNYPSDEYGMLTGKVESVSLLPKDSLYAVRISFPGGMTSSYNKPFEFSQQMSGTAEIITGKKRLLERLLNRMKINL